MFNVTEQLEVARMCFFLFEDLFVLELCKSQEWSVVNADILCHHEDLKEPIVFLVCLAK